MPKEKGPCKEDFKKLLEARGVSTRDLKRKAEMKTKLEELIQEELQDKKGGQSVSESEVALRIKELVSAQASSSNSKTKNTNSKSADVCDELWDEVKLPNAQIISEVKASSLLFGDTRKNLLDFNKAVENILIPLRKSHQGYSDAMLLFLWLSSEVRKMILSRTNELKVDVNVTEIELLQTFGCVLRLNLFPFSDEFAYNRFCAPACSLPFQRCHEIIHVWRIAESSSQEQKSTNEHGWDNPHNLQTRYRDASGAVNKKLGAVPGSLLTYDDDAEACTSKQVFEGHVNATCIERKDGWVVIWDMLCSLETGIPKWICLREGGGQVMERTINGTNSYKFLGGELVVYDRFYTSLNATKALAEKNVRSLGVLSFSRKRDHPFDIHTFNRWTSIELINGASNRQMIYSYPGMGPTINIAQLKSTASDSHMNVLAIAVNVNSRDAKGGIVKFLLSTSQNDSGFSKIEHLASFVMVPLHVNPSLKKTLLVNAAAANDECAVACLNQLKENAKVVSEMQGDAAWGNGRHGTITASQAAPSVKACMRMHDKLNMSIDTLKIRIALSRPSSNELTECSEDSQEEGCDPSLSSNSTGWYKEAFGSLESQDDSTDPSSEVQKEIDDADGEGHEDDVEKDLLSNCQDTASSDDLREEQNILGIATSTSLEDKLKDAGASGDISHLDEHDDASHNISPLDELEALLWRNVAQSYQSVKPTAAMRLGSRVEADIIRFAAQLPIVRGSKIYRVGFVLNRSVPYAGCSPDGIFDSTHGVCLLECKTITSKCRCVFEAKTVKFVKAGEEAFYNHVPTQFRAQLLHQASVTGIPRVLLIIAAPDGPYSSVFITYDHEILQEYLNLLKHSLFQKVYGWLYPRPGESLDVPDSEIIDRIPSSAPQAVRILLSSHVPLLRALMRWRDTNRDADNEERPLPPTKVFRRGVVHFYNLGKTGVDSFCKDIAQVTNNRTSCLAWEQLAAQRYLYMCLVTGLKMAYTNSYVKSEYFMQRADMSLSEFRRQVRAFSGRITEQAYALSDEIFAFCRESVMVNIDPSPKSPGNKPYDISYTQIRGAYPEKILQLVQKRCKDANRPLSRIDFCSGIPLDDYVISATPNVTLDAKYVEQVQKLVPQCGLIPFFNEGHISTRVERWNTLSGVALRTCKYILHGQVVRETRKECWCGSKTHTILCVFCGVELCQSCFNNFHKDTVFDPSKSSSSRASKKMRSSTDESDSRPLTTPRTPVPFRLDQNPSPKRSRS